MTDPKVGDVFQDASIVSKLPEGTILVRTKDNTLATRPGPGSIQYFVEGGSGHDEFRIAYLPTPPKPEPKPKSLLPLVVTTDINRSIEVRDSWDSGAWIQVKSTIFPNDNVAAALSKQNARHIARGLLTAIGDPIRLVVGDKVYVEDKDGYRHGETGVITEELDSDQEYFVRFEENGSSYIHESNLRLSA